MIYTEEEFCQKFFSEVHRVYDIFKNHFGEDKVDLQPTLSVLDILAPYLTVNGNFDVSDEDYNSLVHDYASITIANILVYWPEVTVTNENNKSIVIQELYAKIALTGKGNIPYEYCGFKLNRSKYSSTQFLSSYMHSHISSIPVNNFASFQQPCLGTGPIRGTIATLKTDSSNEFWMLFCHELSMYVTVESLRGVPYRKLESVGKFSREWYNDYVLGYGDDIARYSEIKKAFEPYYLKHGHLSFSYMWDQFLPSMSFYRYMLDISNCFIDFLNSEEFPKGDLTKQTVAGDLLVDMVIQNEKFYYYGSERNASYTRYIGKPVCTFKGNTITLQIEDDTTEETNNVKILNMNLSMSILNKILQTLNISYGNAKNFKYSSTGDFTPTRRVILKV